MKTITQALAFLALITTSTYCLATTTFKIQNKLNSNVTLKVTGDAKGRLHAANRVVYEGQSISLAPGSTTKVDGTTDHGRTDITFVLSFKLNNKPIDCTFNIETNNGLEYMPPLGKGCSFDVQKNSIIIKTP